MRVHVYIATSRRFIFLGNHEPLLYRCIFNAALHSRLKRASALLFLRFCGRPRKLAVYIRRGRLLQTSPVCVRTSYYTSEGVRWELCEFGISMNSTLGMRPRETFCWRWNFQTGSRALVWNAVDELVTHGVVWFDN